MTYSHKTTNDFLYMQRLCLQAELTEDETRTAMKWAYRQGKTSQWTAVEALQHLLGLRYPVGSFGERAQKFNEEIRVATNQMHGKRGLPTFSKTAWSKLTNIKPVLKAR